MAPLRRKKISISLLIPFAIVALVFGGLIWKKLQDSRELKPVPTAAEPAAMRKGVLFFVGDGGRLVREARELDPCSDSTECLKNLLDELFSGPVGDLESALPDAAAVIAVKLAGDLAVIDLNRQFADDLPSGSSAEMLAVYSIVNTVCVNVPGVLRVRLTIDGSEKPLLKHLDLSDPLPPDYSLEQAAVPSESAGKNNPPPAVKKGKP
jgi:hypothetical protein